MTRLAGKVALITGGGTGIGRACGLLFAGEGARVVLNGRRREPLEKTVNEIEARGGQALTVTGDVSHGAEVEHIVGAAVERFGRLDAVINNAGALLVATAEQTSEEEFDRVVAVNLRGTFLVSRAAIPRMRKAGGGAIVNIASVLGLVGMRNRAAYAASKSGVVGLTRAMALDHAHEAIRINCICPALVETELVAGLFSSQPDPAAARRARIEQLPLGRMGSPEDVAQMALFLVSEESSWLTGAALPLDGGLTAY